MPKRHTHRIGDFASLFVRLEELVLANSGADAFEEVFKLLVAKLRDERGGCPPRFRANGDADETFDAVSALLREAERAWPGILEPFARPTLTPDHLQVCVEVLARHTISDASLEVMDGLFEFLIARSAKGAKGQYFTPRHVVEFCVRMLEPAPEETVLDPACGSGGFLIHTLNFVRERHGLPAAALRRYSEEKLWGFDIDARAVRVAKALMILAGDGNANILRLNSLAGPTASDLFAHAAAENGESQSAPRLTIEDVARTRLRHHRGFDVILTNPPFAGEVREPRLLAAYELARGRSRIERDILFLERCVQLLRPGGRMAILLPHNKLATDAWGYVREWLLRRARVLAVVGLGRHTFLPHTHQKASILFARRHEVGERGSPAEPIFFAVSERDGKNSRGQPIPRAGANGAASAWERLDHDLDEIAALFHEFQRDGARSGVEERWHSTR